MRKSTSKNLNSHRLWHRALVLGATSWFLTVQVPAVAGSEAETAGTHSDESDLVSHDPRESDMAETTTEGEEKTDETEVDFSTDDIAYLTQLGLIRGHLAVGYTLYQRNLPSLAETHMKHPGEEIYSDIVSAFAVRGCAGFGDELTQLSDVVSGRETPEDVTESYESLTQAIALCEQRTDTSDPFTIGKVIENLLHTAGIEYQIGVVDSKINNLHEYQDAWGFTQIANDWAQSSAFSGITEAESASAEIQKVINGLDGMWPALELEEVPGGDAVQLFTAAENVKAVVSPLRQ